MPFLNLLGGKWELCFCLFKLSQVLLKCQGCRLIRRVRVTILNKAKDVKVQCDRNDFYDRSLLTELLFKCPVFGVSVYGKCVLCTCITLRYWLLSFHEGFVHGLTFVLNFTV